MNQEHFRGNERQLKLLLKAIREKDISIWNKFITSNGKYFVANLEGADLSYLDLKEINLNGANLKNANLEGSDFTRGKFTRVKFMGANLSMANFTKANLSDSFFKGAKFNNANASGANLENSDLTDVILDGTNLENANIINTSFSNASLIKVNMKGVKKLKTVKIQPKARKRILSPEDMKKLSPWKLAKKEETLRRLEREEKAKQEQEKLLNDGLKSKDRLNRYIVGEEA